jgi:hypothetical protein
MPEDDNATTETEFKNPATQFGNFLIIILFVGYCLVGYIWGGSGQYNSFLALGGWFWLGGIALFKFTPMLIALRSPKFSSNKIGTTIATTAPLTRVEPQGGYPEMALYPAGSVMAMEFFDIKMTTKAMVWAPSSLVYVMGEQDRGVNVVVNCHLDKLADSSELAPHLAEATKRITRLGYKESLPIYVGLFPLLTNILPEERLNEYRRRFEERGISREQFDGDLEKKVIGIRQILEQYAAETSKFRYGVDFNKPEQMQATIIKSQSSLIDQLKRDNKFYKTEITAIQSLTKYARDIPREETWKDKLPMGGSQRDQSQERDSQENNRGGRY